MFIVCFCLILAKKVCLIPSTTNDLGILTDKSPVLPHSEKWDLVEASTRGGDRGRTKVPECCMHASDFVQQWGGSTKPPCRPALVCGGDAQGDNGPGVCDGSCASHPVISAIASLAAGAVGDLWTLWPYTSIQRAPTRMGEDRRSTK